VPYLPESAVKTTVGAPGNAAKTYTFKEIGGMVFVWFHAEGKPPWFELTMLAELEEMRYVGRLPVADWHMHVMESGQNTVDWYHFLTTHNWFGQEPDITRRNGVLHVEYDTSCRSRLLRSKDDDGVSEMTPETIVIDERIKSVKLFGRFDLPDTWKNYITAQARYQSPGVVGFKLTSAKLGTMIAVMTWTPKEPFLQYSSISAWRSPSWPAWLARILLSCIKGVVEQDRMVWEHTLKAKPKRLVAGDGPFNVFTRWLDQFYTKRPCNGVTKGYWSGEGHAPLVGSARRG